MNIRRGKSQAARFLDELVGEPLSFGALLRAIRLGEELTQKNFSEKLGISVQHLCNIEKGQKVVSLKRAVRFAKVLGYSETQFVRLVLQDELKREGLDYHIELSA